MQQAINQAQAQIELANAQGGRFFFAGPRALLLWVCTLSFGFNYLLQPLLTWGIHLFALSHNGALIELPQIDVSTMVPILRMALGLGTMRTVEKAQGVQGDH